jgi:hypothetical protein
MARGWESKSVESQIDGAQQSRHAEPRQLSNDDKELEREKQNLLLSRAYICQQMESSANGRYTETLRKSLEEIDRKLAELTRNH